MTATEWRGRLDEDQTDDLPIDEACRAAARLARCCGSLLRPYRATVAVLALVVVVENAARLSVPLLVQRGIDHGIPPIIDGGSARTLLIDRGGALAVVVLVQAISRMFFLRPLRPHRPAGAAGVAAPGVPALPATRRRLP